MSTSPHRVPVESPTRESNIDKKPKVPKLAGRVHPWKPRTPQQISEFAALWRNPDITLAQIARRYQSGPRSVQRWRKEWGLPRKDDLLKLRERAASIATGAQIMVENMGSAATQTIALVQADAKPGEVATFNRPDIEGRPIVDAELLNKKWNPLMDEEITRELEEVRQEARRITQHSDLTALQRRLARLAILVSTKMPVYTWESLQTILDSLSRTVLWARKVEAEIPQTGADPVLLRQEAGRQMMRELREVLTIEDQQALATIVKRGADAIMAKKGIVSARVEPEV